MEFIGLIAYIMGIFLRPQEWVEYLKDVPLIDAIACFTIITTWMRVSSQALTVPRMPESILICGFFIAGLLSHLSHTYFGGIIFTADSMSKILILYFLIIIIVDSINKIKVVTWVIILCATFNALSGIQQYYRGYGFDGMAPLIESGDIIRILGVGIFNDPNDLAVFFAMAFPLILVFIFRKKGLLTKAFSIFCASALVWALWLTNSRSGFLAFIVAVLAYFKNKFRWAKWTFFGVIFFAIIINVLPSRLGGSMFDDSSRDRLIFWGEGNRMFKANPLFGVGYDMFGEYCDSRACHNSFINCYAELGFVGYFFWLGLIYTAVYGLWKSNDYFIKEKMKHVNPLLPFSNAFLASIIGFLSGAILLSRTYTLPLYILLALGVKTRYMMTDGTYLAGSIFPTSHYRKILILSAGSIVFFYLSTIFLKKF